MKLLPLLLLLFTTQLFSPVERLNPRPRPGKDFALFFAVSEYENMTSLPQTIKNARDIATVLKESYGFQTEVVENPTLDDIVDKIEEYQNLFTPNTGRYASDGQLFIFFAGHGVRENNNGYFLPADANPDRLFQTAIAYDIWRPKIGEINCQHILVAVDACYSLSFDPDWRNMSGGRKFERKGELSERDRILENHRSYKARLFYTSDAKDDMVPGRSNFSRQLLKGLREMRGRYGFITSSELYSNYIEKANPPTNAGDFEGDDPTASFLFFRKINTNTIVNAQQDRAAWQQAQNRNTLNAYLEYQQNFPNGEFIPLADQKIRQLEEEARDYEAWQRAKQTNTREAYQNYLNNFKNGAYRELAQLALGDLPAMPSPSSSTRTTSVPNGMSFIKGGTFKMGDQFGEGDSDELPVHSVTVDDFYMSQHEVTFEEFAVFVEETGYRTIAEREGKSRVYEKEWIEKAGINWKNPGLKQNDQHPVVHISWYDAIKYCNWLSEKRGLEQVYFIEENNQDTNNKNASDSYKWSVTANFNASGYRLPTEAEWEYAAREGGEKVRFGNGKNIADPTEMNFDGSESYKKSYSIAGSYRENTTVVGSFSPNSLGIYDMSGNVWEWCWDWYDESYYKSSSNNEPKGAKGGQYRVVRGGSWGSIPNVCRASVRLGFNPNNQVSALGFRLVRH